MSTQHPSDFIGSLVEMAKAYEELPKVQAELYTTGDLLEEERKTVQDRELSIARLKAELETAHASIRSLEVERDDAQFHSLEADDRTSRALEFIKASFGSAGALIQSLEPVKPQPEPILEPVRTAEPMVEPISTTKPEGLHTTQPSGQSENPLPISEDTQAISAASSVFPLEVSTDASPASEVVPAHPTPDASSTGVAYAYSPIGPNPIFEPVLPSADATSLNQSSPTSPPGRYSGKTYSVAKLNEGLAWEWPNKEEWLSNGGTLDNFYA